MDFGPILIYKLVQASPLLLNRHWRFRVDLEQTSKAPIHLRGQGRFRFLSFPFTFSLISSMTPAGFGRRYIAFLLDIFFLEILGVLATMPLVNQTDQDLARVVIRWFGTGMITTEGTWLVGLYGLLQFLLWSLYFIGFTGACGQTPGKKLLGLQVVHINGTPIDWEGACIRFWIGYPVSILPLGLGFYWALIDKNNQAWHDKIAGTWVIRTGS